MLKSLAAALAAGKQVVGLVSRILREKVKVRVAGRDMLVPVRLTWLGAELAPNQSVREALAGYLPRPARNPAEGVVRGDAAGYVTSNNPHFVKPVGHRLMKWADAVALSLGIEGPRGEQRADLAEFALRVRAWLATRPFNIQALLDEEGKLKYKYAARCLLRFGRGSIQRAQEALGLKGVSAEPLLLTLLAVARGENPQASLEERAAFGGKVAARILGLEGGLSHPAIAPLLRQAQEVWAARAAHTFVQAILGEGEDLPAAPPAGGEDPLGVPEWVLVASATSPRQEEREAYEAFLTHLINLVDQEGEVEWVDPLRLYRKADKAFHEALRERGRGLALRPAAAACLTVRVEAERARAGIPLGRPASEEVYQVLNLVWLLLGEARSKGRELPFEEAEQQLASRFGVTLTPKAADEVAQYLVVSQGWATFLNNPIDGTDELTFGESIPADGGGPEEALEKKEVEEEVARVGAALNALTRALEEQQTKAKARAMVGALWARHALGLKRASEIRRWVETQRGMDPQALPAEDEALLAVIKDLEGQFQVLYLATSRRWQVKF